MNKKTFRSVKGTQDILPDSSRKWIQLERRLHHFMALYGYRFIKTPAFEKTELFARGVGEGTDIVSKEMYTWSDVSGDSLTLKPELTAPIVRSFIQHNLASKSPTIKLYYLDSLFRRERPQKGRYRQFNQFGIEAFGSPHPEQDSEILSIAYLFLKQLGVSNMKLKVNSIGSGDCRIRYGKALKDFLKPFEKVLSETSRHRLETNPLRILDTKIPEEIEILKGAPEIGNFLTKEDQKHFSELVTLLKDADIPFEIEPRLVRGLDYYTRTTFEITTDSLGAQDALCGGGRYDGLVEMLGGQPTPGIGFAAGIERIMLALDERAFVSDDGPVAYIVLHSENGLRSALGIASKLRQAGIPTDLDMQRRSFKAQMREANRLSARFAVILGEEEIGQGTVSVKNLSTGKQKKIPSSDLAAYLNSENESGDI